MPTNSKINKDIAFTFGTQLLVQAIGFIVGVIITRILGPEGKGAYAILLADVNLFVLFFGFSINTGITYFISKNEISRNKIMGVSLMHFFLGLTLSIIIILLSGKSQILNKILYPQGYDDWFYRFFLLSAFTLTFLNSIFSAFYNGLKNFRKTNFVALLNSMLGIILYSLVFILLNKGIIQEGLIFILIIYDLILFVISLYFIVSFIRLKQSISFKFSFSKEYKPFIIFIFIGHLSILLNFFNYRFDLWVINSYCTTSDVGYYSLAANLGSLFMIFSNTLMMVLLPHLTSSNQEQKKHYLKLYSKINFSLLLLIVLLLLPTAQYLIPFIYGESFEPSVILFLILLPGIIFSASTKIFAQYLISLNKLKYNLIATSIGFAFTIVLDLIFIPTHGIIAASVISSIVYLIIFLVVFYHTLKISTEKAIGFFIVSLDDIKKVRNILYEKFKRS